MTTLAITATGERDMDGYDPNLWTGGLQQPGFGTGWGSSLPGWAHILGLFVAAQGLWGLAKLVFSRTFARKEKLWDHVLQLTATVGDMKAEIAVLKSEKSQLEVRVQKLAGYCRWLQRAALIDINLLRAELQKPPLAEWPPAEVIARARVRRPETPPAV